MVIPAKDNGKIARVVLIVGMVCLLIICGPQPSIIIMDLTKNAYYVKG